MHCFRWMHALKWMHALRCLNGFRWMRAYRCPNGFRWMHCFRCMHLGDSIHLKQCILETFQTSSSGNIWNSASCTNAYIARICFIRTPVHFVPANVSSIAFIRFIGTPLSTKARARIMYLCVKHVCSDRMYTPSSFPSGTSRWQPLLHATIQTSTCTIIIVHITRFTQFLQNCSVSDKVRSVVSDELTVCFWNSRAHRTCSFRCGGSLVSDAIAMVFLLK